MTGRVTIVDYGASNLLNVVRALTHLGAEAKIGESAREVAEAEKLILPGVGAFGDSMAEISARGLSDAIKIFVESGRPFLGICVGMQLMLEESCEFGRHEGLALIPGRVEAIPAAAPDGKPLTVPHMGWSEVSPPQNGITWKGSLLDGLSPGTSFYFAHSYIVVPEEENHRLVECNYDGVKFCAGVRKENLHGLQFHPEKSASAGLEVLRAFLQ